jgi:hypothetical protein
MNLKTEFPTGENRKSLYQYSDPLVLNFKLLIEFDGKNGLFGDEKYPNTALAYLKRVGEDERFELLKHLILLYKNFTKNLDFLMKTVEGLDRIVNLPPSHMFGYDEDKITINIDETTDMYVQSMIYLYREICYDAIRKVVVLPSNLQSFNCNVLLFASGYYSTDYDKVESADGVNDEDINHAVLPTKKKLFYDKTNEFTSKLHESYNHTIFRIEGCKFLVDECGKSFVSEISNEMSDNVTKNNLTFKFNSAQYNGRFNNLVGDKDITRLLFESALSNKQPNVEENKFTVKAMKDELKKAGKSAGKTLLKNSTQTLKEVGITKLNNVFGMDMMFPPVQSFSFENTFLRAGTKLFDMALQKTESITEDLENKAKSMLLNNFSNRLLNGFIIPSPTATKKFPNTPLAEPEITNQVTMLEVTPPPSAITGNAKLASTERFAVEVSVNKTKLFF